MRGIGTTPRAAASLVLSVALCLLTAAPTAAQATPTPSPTPSPTPTPTPTPPAPIVLTRLTAASAVGVTTVGPFTALSKTPRPGEYVTVRWTLEPAVAGQRIEVYISTKGADGAWGAWDPLTARLTDARGMAYFDWQWGTATWISLQGRFEGNAQLSPARAPSVQIHWSTARPAVASANGLALTPPMGWNDWNAYGCRNNWSDVEQTARYMHTSGLQAAGYEYVIVDGCWNDMVGQGTQDPNGYSIKTPLPVETCGAVDGRLPDGQIFVNAAEFPPTTPCANDGLKRVAAYVHALGLKFGLWLDATDNWNCQHIPGSFGFDREDATTLAAWGVDYVKADWCPTDYAPPAGDPTGGPFFFNQTGTVNGHVLAGATHEQLARWAYGDLGAALAATGRPIVFSVCAGYDGAVAAPLWAGSVANLWRTTGDIGDSFASLVGIVNQNIAYAAYAHPGAWNDPDMLEVGNGGMSPAEDRSEFSLWAEMAAPLIMGTNLANPAGGSAQLAYDRSIYGNRDVIAVDQDPLGRQGTVVSFDGTRLVLAKPLANGDVAVTLFNEGSQTATISTTAAAIGLPRAASYLLRDLWTHATKRTSGVIRATVAPHATLMYRVSAVDRTQGNP